MGFVCVCVCPFAEGLEEPCKKKDLGDGVYSFEYYPTTPGNYIITITWGGQHIPRRSGPASVRIEISTLNIIQPRR